MGQPALPAPRGPLSEFLIESLRDPPGPLPPEPASVGGALGEDLQLSLYVLYELHYRGFREVPESWEWQAALLAVRAALEADFEACLREQIPAAEAHPS